MGTVQHMQLVAISDLDLNTKSVTVRYVNDSVQVIQYDDEGEDYRRLYIKLLDKYGSQHNDLADYDFNTDWRGSRWRGSLYAHTRGQTISLRYQSPHIASLKELGFDDEGQKDLLSLCQQTGLTLFAGPVGAGKSSTLAACMDALLSQNRLGKTIVIGDPVEHEIDHPRVHHREVHVHVNSFADGIYSAMRQGTETIILTELRRPEEAEAAVDAGLTGHKVWATLHSSSVPEVLDRLWGLLDDRHDDLLPMALNAVVVQELIRIPDGPVLPIWETLSIDPQCQSLLREGSKVLPQLVTQQYRQGRMSFLERAKYFRDSGQVPRAYLEKWL